MTRKRELFQPRRNFGVFQSDLELDAIGLPGNERRLQRKEKIQMLKS